MATLRWTENPVQMLLLMFIGAMMAAQANGDLNEILTSCCVEGIKQAEDGGRCDSYGARMNVSRQDMPSCMAIIEVCCMKELHLQQCALGKEHALADQMCIMRDTEPGREQYMECCHCCKLGRTARRSGLSCESPVYGVPCDTMFVECCTGREVSYNRSTEGYNCGDKNPCEQQCQQDGDGVMCSCEDGYQLNEDQTTCSDIDECALGFADCGPLEECVNVLGRYTCQLSICPPGYVKNSITGNCEQKIDCPPGFGLNKLSGMCEDINECAVGAYSCQSGERCENQEGSYICRRIYSCGTGYTLDTDTQRCVDTDECSLGIHNCGNGYQCQNTNGSFRCIPNKCAEGQRFNKARGVCERVSCRRGFRPGHNGACVDINECKDYNNVCGNFQRCRNTLGSYKCHSTLNCPTGFQPADNGRCVDIDECEAGSNRCGSDQQCVNRQGSYFCQCPRGYRTTPGNRCEDVDECAYGAAICPSSSRCTNTPGSYTCTCKEGLQDAGQGSCSDIDECQTPNICHHSCVNVIGSYFCSCNRGYQLAEDKRLCEDINECTQFGGRGGRGGIRGGVCGGRCVNLQGSYRCECPEGWRVKADGRSCEDIDECATNVGSCRNREEFCVNVRGGFKCPLVRCPDGFVKIPSGGRQNSFRCKKKREDCKRCKEGLLSLSYNFLTFPTNVIIPAALFSMTGANDEDKFYSWELTVLSAEPRGAGVVRAGRGYFSLEESSNQAVVSLIKRIQGPQDVVLQLRMTINNLEGFEGYAESRLYLFITDDNVA